MIFGFHTDPRGAGPAVHDHGADGIRLLMQMPRRLASGLIYIVLGLLGALLIWAFYGRADVVVTVEGVLKPESEMRRVYPPTSGYLVEMYAVEGSSVQRGDVLARIRSEDAVRAAAEAEQARLRLEQLETEERLFPRQKALMRKEIENLWRQIGQTRREYDHLERERYRNLPAAQKNQLRKLRLQVADADLARRAAGAELDKYQRLFALAGHGGISEREVDEKQRVYEKSLSRYRELELDLEHLEFDFTKETNLANRKLDQAQTALLQFQFERDRKILEMENQEKRLQMQLRAARAAWEAVSNITLDDFDADSLLVVKAPVSGVVTYVSATQPGETAEGDAPLVVMAPTKVDKTLAIRIPEADRGMLRAGQAVRVKFNAFPFQRYGAIDGVLEYISPGALQDEDGGLYYEGRVGLERDRYRRDGEDLLVRYGMTATAEIAVEKRRIIDLVIDPFRKLKQRDREGEASA